MAASPSRAESRAKLWQLKQRLEKCRNYSLDWSLYPENISEGCKQVGLALDMPPDAILSGLLLLMSFCMSHCAIQVPGTVWIEPAILWIVITMPTGSGKSPLFLFLTKILKSAREKLSLTNMDPPWLLDTASFEKMGELMANNQGRLLGLYDELSSFLAQINVYRGKGLCESQDLSTFLSLYTGKYWNRATVSGDANFTMEKTALTVGGFTQPAVARSLIELPASVEKGLTQRFLWIFPKPSFAKFNTLQLVDNDFSTFLIQRLSSAWKATGKGITLTIPHDCVEFQQYYDSLQEKISKLSVIDELMAGMLSKSKGQVLRVAAAMHILFSPDDIDEELSPLPNTITTCALIAAINYVDTCCQHGAFIAGRGKVDDEIKSLTSGGCVSVPQAALSLEAYCLLLPGQRLALSALLAAKKFRSRGNKEGALGAFRQLENDKMGWLETQDSHRGAPAVYVFHKEEVNEDNMDDMLQKLSKYGLTVSQYQASFQQKEIGASLAGTKRMHESENTPPPPVRRSPRKRL